MTIANEECRYQKKLGIVTNHSESLTSNGSWHRYGNKGLLILPLVVLFFDHVREGHSFLLSLIDFCEHQFEKSRLWSAEKLSVKMSLALPVRLLPRVAGRLVTVFPAAAAGFFFAPARAAWSSWSSWSSPSSSSSMGEWHSSSISSSSSSSVFFRFCVLPSDFPLALALPLDFALPFGLPSGSVGESFPDESEAVNLGGKVSAEPQTTHWHGIIFLKACVVSKQRMVIMIRYSNLLYNYTTYILHDVQRSKTPVAAAGARARAADVGGVTLAFGTGEGLACSRSIPWRLKA